VHKDDDEEAIIVFSQGSPQLERHTVGYNRVRSFFLPRCADDDVLHFAMPHIAFAG